MKYCFQDEFKKIVQEIDGNDILSDTDLQQGEKYHLLLSFSSILHFIF